MKVLPSLWFLTILTTSLSNTSAGQWVETNTPEILSVRCLAYLAPNLYAGGHGLFLSSDNGADWKQVNATLSNQYVYCIANKGVDLFVGTLHGVFLSTNDGETWTQANLPDTQFESIAFSGTEIFAGAYSGAIFVSTDNGLNWTQRGLLDTTLNVIAISGPNLIAGTDAGMFVSTDKGTNWARAGLANIEVYALLASGGTTLAGTSAGTFTSSNNGIDWAQNSLIGTPIWALADAGTFLFAGSPGVFGGTQGVFRSSDDGITWTQMDSTLYVLSLVVTDTNLFAGGFDAVYRSTNSGLTWSDTGSGLNMQSVNCFACVDTLIFAGTNGTGVFLSSDNGGTWIPANTGLTNYRILSFITVGNSLYAGTADGVFRSSNAGASWTRRGLIGSTVTAFATAGSKLFAGTYGDGVFLSSDSGATWVPINTGLTLFDLGVTTLAISNGNLFAGTFDGLFESTNMSGSWTATGLSGPYIWSLATCDTSLFAGTFGGGAYVSTNGGSNWLQAGLGSTTVEAFAVSGNNVFAATQIAGSSSGRGVFLTTNNGTTWTSTDFTATNDIASSLSIIGPNLFAGGYSIYRRPLSEMITGIEGKGSPSPERLILQQNYPNPFNPVTVISYQLPASTHVILKVFDALGRQVETLADGRQNAGAHYVIFNGTNLPSGVYFYRLEAGTYHDTKKLLLLK